MLVPHEPDLDPRVDWVIKLCAEIGKTDIFGFVFETKRPLREYDQTIYLERVLYQDLSMPPMMRFLNRLILGQFHPRLLLHYIYYTIHHVAYLLVKSLPRGEALIAKARRIKQDIRKESSIDASRRGEIPEGSVSISEQEPKAPSIIRHSGSENSITQRVNVLLNIWKSFYSQKMIAHTLFQRARASSIVPKVIVCHDIQALEAGVKLKEKFRARLLYDSHELWIEGDLTATSLEKHIVKIRERKLIRCADIVITVTPQIARYLEKVYGIENVLTVPNAEPLLPHLYTDRTVSLPVKFLLQGRATPGRGFEEFLELWSRLDDSRALLILRCPDNPFFTCLKQKYKHLIDQGKIVVATPVKETDLVQAASSADVGIIPYGGPNLNHVYACPNKLSQYMQAGLAILHNSDQQYVTEIVSRRSCGVSYDVSNPSSLLDVVRNLLDDPELLRKMKRNSYETARSEFNWEIQSKAYSQAIQRLFEA